MSPEEHKIKTLKDTCQTRILQHLAEGGTVEFGRYGFFDPKDPTGLAEGCGCALSIACAPLVSKEGCFTSETLREIINRHLNLFTNERKAFALGFDAMPLPDVESEPYHHAGKEVREWYFSHGFHEGMRLFAEMRNETSTQKSL